MFMMYTHINTYKQRKKKQNIVEEKIRDGLI